MSVTIKDVAKAANVSVATVSRVLNKKTNVSDEAVEAVNRAIERLEYSPNFLGRDLRKSETRRILAIIASTEQSFYSEVLRGMEEAAGARGYDVLIATTRDDPKHEMHLLEMLFSRSVDGAVLLGPKLDARTISALSENHNIAICLERLENCNVLTVTINNVSAGRDAVNYLIRKGRRRIGLITTKQRSQSSVDRERGYREALAENEIEYDESLVYYGDYSPESGTHGCEALMSLQDPPDAIFAISDMIAIGAMNYAAAHRIGIGKDILFFGFDNIQYSRIFIPHLSTVQQPCFLQGKLVVEKLIDNMKSETPDRSLYMLPHSLILRETTGD
ncbi:MAG: LacI family DNA-binding transcriptional regulator [Bacteroides sp.]|nr:LacI family DNA-binding transcriptional regulator [Eubacterium sp.]MCM1417274.1 LacI family DNA-binding transcriptional regulator [Roseburia sp.]MCM1461106.1 LacI family DNA-binding transcriptional regulator [Bacteroides sp.]